MRKLTVKSTDNFGYEEESLNFLYNGNVIFSQLNEKLNRGGKTLCLYDWAGKEELLSSSAYLRGEKWWRKMSNKLKELNYDVSAEEIRIAIEIRQKENKNKKLTEVIQKQTSYKKELEQLEKRVMFLRKEVNEGKSLIKRLTNI